LDGRVFFRVFFSIGGADNLGGLDFVCFFALDTFFECEAESGASELGQGGNLNELEICGESGKSCGESGNDGKSKNCGESGGKSISGKGDNSKESVIRGESRKGGNV
jgi:hypothetical protein